MYVRSGVTKLLIVSVFMSLEGAGEENQTQIVDGLELNLEEFSYQVSLHLSYNDQFLCGGSIISSKMVLTAARCMYYDWGGLLPPIIITVTAGRNNLNDYPLETFEVANITLHPSFDKSTMENNLALIEISNEFPLNNLIKQVSLEKQLVENEYNNCVITGWDKNSYNLQVVEVIIVDCENYPRNICTNQKNENETICISDAGNPLVCDGNLIGVLSVEPNCDDPSQLTIFENIRNSLSWLDERALSSSSITRMFYLLLLIVPISTSFLC